jgi:hypothetical protein
MSAKHLVAYAILLLGLLLLLGWPVLRARGRKHRGPRHERIDLIGSPDDPREP